MRWHNMLLVWTLACFGPAWGSPVDNVVETTQRLLRSGQASEALQYCREAQVEHPDSAELLFAIATAETALAEQLLRQGESPRAAETYREARETFIRAGEREPDRLQEAAAYNAATCLIRLDATFQGDRDYEDRVTNLRRAAESLEDFLDRHPEHERARKNLDHARFRLNLLLQAPPSQGDEEKEQEGEDEGTVSAVETATTQIPGATAEVVDGSTVVLHWAPRGEDP
jgi:tetratricopeptide (TPR) repeat protein